MTQLALTLEVQNMPAFMSGEVKSGVKRDRKAYDGLVPYRSDFTPGFWELRPGSSRCVCWACNDGFNSVKAFERHQVMSSKGDTICRDPATLGMVRNATGWWITEARDMEADK